MHRLNISYKQFYMTLSETWLYESDPNAPSTCSEPGGKQWQHSIRGWRNSTKHLCNIPKCTGALWDKGLVYCGICKITLPDITWHHTQHCIDEARTWIRFWTVSPEYKFKIFILTCQWCMLPDSHALLDLLVYWSLPSYYLNQYWNVVTLTLRSKLWRIINLQYL